MKKWMTAVLSAVMVLSLAACRGNNTAQSSNDESTTEDTQNAVSTEAVEGTATEAVEEDSTADTASPAQQDTQQETAQSNILIAYFSMPEDIDTNGIDADSGASVVVDEGEVLGNVQYMAQIIEENTDGELFRIETTEQYPLDHDPLVDQAAQEQDDDARPELSTHIENLDQYDTIFLGYPNWWGDMPQALYTFLEEYDFSGKTIIPFCPHGGSGFSGTESTIAEIQPDATVSEDGLTIPRDDVADCEEEVIEWLDGLNL